MYVNLKPIICFLLLFEIHLYFIDWIPGEDNLVQAVMSKPSSCLLGVLYCQALLASLVSCIVVSCIVLHVLSCLVFCSLLLSSPIFSCLVVSFLSSLFLSCLTCLVLFCCVVCILSPFVYDLVFLFCVGRKRFEKKVRLVPREMLIWPL